jgi:hypothetical protein
MAKSLGDKQLNLTGEDRCTKIILHVDPNGQITMEWERQNVWKNQDGQVQSTEQSRTIIRHHSYLSVQPKFGSLMADILKITDDVADEDDIERAAQIIEE